jgi:hypothetical protein
MKGYKYGVRGMVYFYYWAGFPFLLFMYIWPEFFLILCKDLHGDLTR